jgi:hypothetical protein
MAKSKKPKLPYDTRGGVIVISRAMLEADAYQSLPATAKALMIVMQTQWRNDRAVSYGVREAALKIGCTTATASKAFKLLQERGFIVCNTESFFNSRTGSKAREWRLTWMPFLDKKPTYDWETWQSEIKATVSK